MSEYNEQHRKEHHGASLELRKNRLQTLFQEELKQLQAEEKGLVQDRKTRRGQQWQKRDSTEGQEMREKVGYSPLTRANGLLSLCDSRYVWFASLNPVFK